MTDLTTKAAEIRAGLVADWRKAMEGVTPGPYFANPKDQQEVRLDYGKQEAFAYLRRTSDVAWITRCSPAGIASLLNLIEQQAAELAEARERGDRYERIAHEHRSFIGELKPSLRKAESERDELLREKERLGAEVESVTSARQYVIGWNDGFAHVNGPLRFPTMLRKMWSGSEVQAWLDAQRIEAAREAAADEGSALTRAETTISSQSERIAVLEAALVYGVNCLRSVRKNYEEPELGLWEDVTRAIRQGNAALAPLGEE